jgi:hypothetical protein
MCTFVTSCESITISKKYFKVNQIFIPGLVLGDEDIAESKMHSRLYSHVVEKER